MAIVLTEKAANEIKRVMTEQKAELPQDAVVRIGVVGGGCSGFQYDFGFMSETEVDPARVNCVEQHGVKVAIDKKSDLYLDGTRIDFYEGLERRGFTFDNPNAVKSCGCGSSFSA